MPSGREVSFLFLISDWQNKSTIKNRIYTKIMKTEKYYQSAPLPFMGQKRMYVKEFREALKQFPEDAIYVDCLVDLDYYPM